ncbi:DUF7742 family protein [Albibacillus kandeliae]|uniref:DUF7742 family protein n=1 Tax=Albibacillus kandeliae TaxID=2174228 RepID=UPI000AA3A1B4|nr:hypothetical protein [Albibacillus kandeliae]
MRPLYHGDIASAARALLAVPAGERTDLAERLVTEARLADRHVRRTGRLHPDWGNGSLMGAAHKQPMAPEPGFDCADYVACWVEVLTCLGRLGVTR